MCYDSFMIDLDIDDLHRFVVRAKAATYAGDGPSAESCRPGSRDLAYRDGRFAYLDSYFGGTDFIGQETVWLDGRAVWAMNYYGYILDEGKIAASEAGRVIKESLTLLYRHGRFLGGFENETALGLYVDENEGDVSHFRGMERIERKGEKVYELLYHGGLIRD